MTQMFDQDPQPKPRTPWYSGLRNSFLTGIVVIAPVGLTVWLIWTVIGWVDTIVISCYRDGYSRSGRYLFSSLYHPHRMACQGVDWPLTDALWRNLGPSHARCAQYLQRCETDRRNVFEQFLCAILPHLKLPVAKWPNVRAMVTNLFLYLYRRRPIRHRAFYCFSQNLISLNWT